MPDIAVYNPTAFADATQGVLNTLQTIALPVLDGRCITNQKVLLLRQESQSVINQMIGNAKLLGLMDEIAKIQVPNFFAQQSYAWGSGPAPLPPDYKAREKQACGDVPTGLRPRARREWFDCVDSWHPNYAIEYNCEYAAQLELDFLKNQQKNLEAAGVRKQALAIQETDLTNPQTSAIRRQGTTSQVGYYIMAAVLLGLIGWLLYKLSR